MEPNSRTLPDPRDRGKRRVPGRSNLLPIHLRYSCGEVSALIIDKRAYFDSNAWAFRLLDSFSGTNVVRVFPHERLCPGETCIVQAGGTPLYYDNQHLSIPGAEYLEPLFEDVFDTNNTTVLAQPIFISVPDLLARSVTGPTNPAALPVSS